MRCKRTYDHRLTRGSDTDKIVGQKLEQHGYLRHRLGLHHRQRVLLPVSSGHRNFIKLHLESYSHPCPDYHPFDLVHNLPHIDVAEL
jgi:hypothetical protein